MVQLEKQPSPVIILQLYRGPAGDITQSSDHIATVSLSSRRHKAVQRSPCDCIVVQFEGQPSPAITLRLHRGPAEDTMQSSDYLATVSWSNWRHNTVQCSPCDCVVPTGDTTQSSDHIAILSWSSSPMNILRLYCCPAGDTTKSSDHLGTCCGPVGETTQSSDHLKNLS